MLTWRYRFGNKGMREGAEPGEKVGEEDIIEKEKLLCM